MKILVLSIKDKEKATKILTKKLEIHPEVAKRAVNFYSWGGEEVIKILKPMFERTYLKNIKADVIKTIHCDSTKEYSVLVGRGVIDYGRIDRLTFLQANELAKRIKGE